MKIIRIILFAFIILQSFTTLAENNNINTEEDISNNDEEININQCMEAANKNILLSGWYLWKPYQYNHVTSGGYELTGMDVQLMKSLAAKVGVGIKYEEVLWKQHQEDIKEGKRDIAAGATYTEERAKTMYFSLPYRYEENSLFVLKNSDKNLNFKNITEYLAQMRLQNFRLGIINGFVYGDIQINEFINDDANKDIIFKYENDTFSLQALLRGEIDGFIADRIVGADVILDKLADNKVKEIQLNIKTPIHLIFSKNSIPLELVDRFNQEIKNFLPSADYKKIMKAYLYPVLLMQTIDSKWFYVVGIIGTIAFAISGIAIAAKENSTLFGTFILAMLPSVGGGIMRDVMINRDTLGIILTPSYMYYILIVVLVGFAAIRLLDYYNSQAEEDAVVKKIWDNLLVICDALGQATFIVTGVSIVIMAKIEPIILWGPFFAFLTSNGGGIIRDLLRTDRTITCLSEELNAEISVLWGIAFSVFLNINAHHPDPDMINYAVVVVVIGAFLTRLLVHYLKIPNLKFR